MKSIPRSLLLVFLFSPGALLAWNYPGHRIINQLAVDSLPPDFPEWVHSPRNAERIAFLAGEPDRWRDSREELIQHYNGLDHYIDLEQLPDAGIDIGTLTPFRYDFTVQFAKGRAAHADKFPAFDPAKDYDHSRRWPGFLPWAIAEYYAKIQVAFSCYKTFQEYGTAEEAANAEENIIYMMGVMGHYVGDGSQPLHVTVHHHGWVGPNPNGYTTDPGIHAWIDGGFIAKAGITESEVARALRIVGPLDVTPRADERDPVFVQVVDYLDSNLKNVEPLYRLYKEGKLVDGGPGSREGREFINERLLAGGEMLGALWLTAWRQSGPTPYLRSDLLKRKMAAAAAGK